MTISVCVSIGLSTVSISDRDSRRNIHLTCNTFRTTR